MSEERKTTEAQRKAIAKYDNKMDRVNCRLPEGTKNRLTQVSVEIAGTPSYRISDISELKLEWFDNVETVAITAGASTPTPIVREVIPAGPACHNGTTSCFTESLVENTRPGSVAILPQLVEVIKQREIDMPEGAYTTYLFDKGIDKICKKVGEEATEVVIGAKNRDKEEVKWESADLMYHLLVLLQEQKVDIYEVLEVLQKRHEGKPQK